MPRSKSRAVALYRIFEFQLEGDIHNGCAGTLKLRDPIEVTHRDMALLEVAGTPRHLEDAVGIRITTAWNGRSERGPIAKTS
jgi:hypothetical protein